MSTQENQSKTARGHEVMCRQRRLLGECSIKIPAVTIAEVREIAQIWADAGVEVYFEYDDVGASYMESAS